METPKDNINSAITMLRMLVNLILVFVLIIVAVSVTVLMVDFNKPTATKQEVAAKKTIVATINLWTAPDIASITDEQQKELVVYGKDLIAHTAKYLGPNGAIKPISNGLNCQNCHLDAGTRPFGNNYGAVAATYPKFRARSGSEEDIYKRVNDCFERSLNGQPLEIESTEMQAIKAYIEFIGSNVPKGKVAEGSGLKQVALLDRAADPALGKIVYDTKCIACHQADGQGTLLPSGAEYAFPPLWGEHSYNDAAGLYRISNFAKYVKYNMPLGATHTNPMLTDEEAWDVAAYVNSLPHPHKEVPTDWPDISKKPMDHPFGPYSDTFTEQQHKFGPFKPIIEAAKTGKVALN